MTAMQLLISWKLRDKGVFPLPPLSWGLNTKQSKSIFLILRDTRIFAEDTYRTLTAVDSAVIVIDCVKGVEIQTEKLMEVCRMRETPVMAFINKLDREGQDPFDLLDEIEKKLNIAVRPLSWPIGMGKSFKGVYDLFQKKLLLFQPSKSELSKEFLEIDDLNDPILESEIGSTDAATLREEVELINGVYPEFDVEEYRKGLIVPIFFGSAVNNFGVGELLDCFIEIAPAPLPRYTEGRQIQPSESEYTGFVFKIHANMDPKHRNRIAFVRVCSGRFQRGNNYHHVRLDKKLRFSNATAFMAQSKEIIDEAYPGDIIGLYDTGNLKNWRYSNRGRKSQL